MSLLSERWIPNQEWSTYLGLNTNFLTYYTNILYYILVCDEELVASCLFAVSD